MNQRREAMNLQQASHIVCSPLDCETGIVLKSGDHDHWDRDSSFYSIGSPTFLTTKVKMILVSLVESLQTSMMFRAGTTNLSQGSGRAWLWVWPRCWAQKPPKNGFGRCVYDIHIYIYNYDDYDYDICYCYCDTTIMLYYDYCSRCYIISILTTNLVFTWYMKRHE